jgi:hypothetical protein
MPKEVFSPGSGVEDSWNSEIPGNSKISEVFLQLGRV